MNAFRKINPGFRLLFFCCVLINLIVVSALYGQVVSQPETGLPFLQNFSPKEYDFHPQNWAIVQDSRGIIFVANTAGLLEYDGVSWRRHELFKNLTVVSLALDRQGRLFIGGRGEFGYLQPDSAGRLTYRSLLQYLPKSSQNIRLVWEIAATTHGVYFRTKNHVFKWDGECIKSWGTKTAFSLLAVVRDTVFVLEKGVGLQTLSGDSLQLIPDGRMFANTAMNVILPFDDNPSKILLGARSDGLFIYDGLHVRRFQTEADAFFRKNQLYHGVRLSGQPTRWAMATTRGGLIILDERGKIRQQLNKKTGLPVNKIHFVFEDRQGGLWLSLNNGLSRVELSTPFAIFDQRLGIEGTPHVVIRHRGVLYAGTNRGLFRLASPAAISEKGRVPEMEFQQIFKRVKGISGQVWALHEANDALLVGTGEGIYRIKGNREKRIAKRPVATYCFYQSAEKGLIFAGARDGLAVLEKKNNGWQFIGKIAGVSQSIRTIARARDGSLWLGTPFQGLLKVTVDDRFPLRSTVEKFGEARGLPGGMNYVYAIDDRVKIATYQGLYRFNPARQTFIPDSSLGIFFADATLTINRLAQAGGGNTWAMAGAKKSRLYRGIFANGAYSWQDKPFRRLADMTSVLDIYPEANGVVWLVGRDEKIYRYDSNSPTNLNSDFPAMVRRVSTIRGDSLIWDGSVFPDRDGAEIIPALPFAKNSLRFEYAAAGYDQPSANRYKIMLEGYDADYHSWTAETKKDYTGLPAGRYVFHVIAKNIYGDISSEGRFAVTILAPWYQRWWAYLLYAFALISIVAVIVKTRIRRLEQKTKQLENIVAERTSIIREQAEKLKTLDAMKSRFFANISHEFRTPLTLILGPIEDMLAKRQNDPDRQTLGLMQRNAKRILQLINQLLDLSRLESGKLKLQARPGDFAAFVKGVVMSFASLAEQKQIDLQFEIPENTGDQPIPANAFFDRDVIEKIFYNLLANAFKFTPEGGAVTVSMSNHKRDGVVEIRVKDSGIGIPTDQQDTIFERFYQVNGGDTREHEGTGIGLALTRELVELHHGEISVNSDVGKGTEFVVIVPVGAAHFSREEIADKPAGDVETTDGGRMEIETPLAEPAAEPTDTRLPEDDIPIILVVDDHDDVRKYIRNHLKNDYKVVEAKNGEAGLNTAIDIIPDMVISDVMMPKLDGYQLCEALKSNEKTSHIPVILLTAKAGEKDKLSGLETGADDYLTKPFNSKELHVRVRNLIKLRRKLQERFQKEDLLKPREIHAPSAEKAFLLRMMRVLEENLGLEEFGVESLSDALGMGRRQLNRKIKAITGETPTDFIRSVRLQRAKQLLESKSGTVSEIAFQTGFGSLSYFSKAFKDQFGKLPSEI